MSRKFIAVPATKKEFTLLQEQLFLMGYEWLDSGKKIADNVAHQGLILDTNGLQKDILWDHLFGTRFENVVTLETTTTYSFEPVKDKMVVFDKVYNVADVRKAMATIPYAGEPV